MVGFKGGRADKRFLPQASWLRRSSMISSNSCFLASGGDDIDYAMGTLMAYGGKYLREMALWAYEYGTQQPVESLNTIASDASSSIASVVR